MTAKNIDYVVYIYKPYMCKPLLVSQGVSLQRVLLLRTRAFGGVEIVLVGRKKYIINAVLNFFGLTC